MLDTLRRMVAVALFLGVLSWCHAPGSGCCSSVGPEFGPSSLSANAALSPDIERTTSGRVGSGAAAIVRDFDDLVIAAQARHHHR